jgi:beta-glucosidase
VRLAALLAAVLTGGVARAGPGPSGCPGPSLVANLPPPATRPWEDATLAPEARTELLLGAMALEEKVDLATGERCYLYGYYNAPIDRLGIPALTMTDGPAGIRIPYQRVNRGRATQLPAPIAVAASFDPSLAREQGDILGAEAFSTGHNVVLGPTLDIARSPLAGRTFEAFGEDPVLSASLAGPMVEGIQAHPVLADAKHYAVYTQETDRWTIDPVVDERTLHEIYLPAFYAAVRAGVGSVMCGFNRVNDVYACESAHLLNEVLKGDLGFEGFVLSDWGSIHGTAQAALAGLDQELAFARYFGRLLVDAVRSGEVPETVVDDKARRILLSMFRLGLFDQPVVVQPLPEREDGERGRAIGEQGVVLLRNEASLLPLDAGALHSVAVIGADAANVATQGGGAARVEPTYGVSPLDGIQARVGGGVQVEYAPGGDPITPAHLLPGPPPVPSSVLTPPDATPDAHGLRGEFWKNPRFQGTPHYVRVDRQIALSSGFFNYQSVNASSVPQLPFEFQLTRFSARWTGTLTAPATGDYVLTLTSRGPGWVFLDGATVIDDSGNHTLASMSATVHLVAGEQYDLRVDYAADTDEIGTLVDVGGDVKLGWEVPPGTVLPEIGQAAQAAAQADVAVVVVRDYGTEERDRLELALPGDQDALVAAVAAANPRTVVVLTTGQPTSMPWLEQVGAVIEAWYPGQEQGNVIARVLFGDVNPSGKLPLTFPRDLSQTPAGEAPQPAPPDGRLVLSEGVLVGYRWYDAHGLDPLFPFGFGLSYTTFGYGDLEVTTAAPDGQGGSPVTTATFTVTNTGRRAGAEVAQVYVGACPGDATQPPRQLAGFAKVQLAPGASARVAVQLAGEALGSWSPETRNWVPAPCELPLQVASSSRDVRLQGQVPPAGTTFDPPVSVGKSGCGSGGGDATWLGEALLAAWLLAHARARPVRARDDEPGAHQANYCGGTIDPPLAVARASGKHRPARGVDVLETTT